MTLTAGETAMAADHAAIVVQQTAEQTQLALGWLKRKLVFEHSTLAQVAAVQRLCRNKPASLRYGPWS